MLGLATHLHALLPLFAVQAGAQRSLSHRSLVGASKFELTDNVTRLVESPVLRNGAFLAMMEQHTGEPIASV